MKNKIAVLLATYNGKKYINEQLDSILNQTVDCVDIIIRDDGSLDGTVDILRRYEAIDRIVLIKDGNQNKGHLLNFASLFDYAKDKYDYIMFSDQDDIWLRNKIERLMRLLKGYEDVPAFGYSNFEIWNMHTNDRKNFLQNHIIEKFEKILVQNWIYGCTMILNRKMIDLISNIPSNVDTHDYWISLCAMCNDNVKILYDSEITMVHRLHDGNATGKQDSQGIKKRSIYLWHILNGIGAEKRINTMRQCCSELEIRYGENNAKVKSLKSILGKNRFKNVINAIKNGYSGMNWHATLAFYLILIKGVRNGEW